jgi:hypothetical protein
VQTEIASLLLSKAAEKMCSSVAESFRAFEIRESAEIDFLGRMVLFVDPRDY